MKKQPQVLCKGGISDLVVKSDTTPLTFLLFLPQDSCHSLLKKNRHENQETQHEKTNPFYRNQDNRRFRSIRDILNPVRREILRISIEWEC